jgi:hypothetical protein
MRKAHLSIAFLLVILASAVAAWAATARYTPPPETGFVWTVVNYARAGGEAQHTSVTVNWDRPRKTIIVPRPSYASTCRTSTPSGFVLRLRHANTASVPLTLTTNGTIVRGPYQGEAPPEALHACYKLVTG